MCDERLDCVCQGPGQPGLWLGLLGLLAAQVKCRIRDES